MFEPLSEKFPYTCRVCDVLPAIVNVPSKPLTVKLAHTTVPLIVIVNAPVPTFELASMKTSSEDVGAVSPPEPPLLAAQFVVVVLHVPVPPTQ